MLPPWNVRLAVAMSLLLCGLVTAPAQKEGQVNRLTLLFELIEIDRSAWNAWTADPANPLDGPTLRTHVQDLIRENRGTIVEMAIVPLQPEQGEVILDSGDEIIFPSEFGGPGDLAETGNKFIHRCPSAYETRNTGLRLSGRCEPMPGGRIGLDLTPEYTQKVDDISAGKGAGQVVFPIFYTIRPTASFSLAPGATVLLSSHRPNQAANGKHQEPVWLAFVRLDQFDSQAP